MKQGIAKGLAAIGGVLALVSGFFWWQSADMQVKLMTELTNAAPNAVARLGLLAAQENLWAGELAAASGFCIALALFLD